MTGASVGDADAAHRTPPGIGPRDLVGRADAVLDGSIVLLATWTVVYHLSLLTGLSSNLALVLEGVLLAGCLVLPQLAAASRPEVEEVAPSTDQGPSREPVGGQATRLTLAAAVVAALAMALDLPWTLVWVSWLVAAVGGLVAVAGPARRTSATTDPGRDRRTTWFALGCALAAAAFASVVLRPNPDDLFYVNLSQWVAEHGSFPVRDTLFGDLTYPMANWPPLASYDGLTGAVAHLLHLRAGDVVYVAVPPLASALAVLALWRLLRAWRVRHLGLALGFALLFLVVDGTSSYGPPGNLFVTRLWQGKVILLCLVVPVLLVHLLRFVERPSRARAAWLLTGGAAAVACSTTAIFLVPVLAVAGVAPLAARRAWRAALTGFACTAAYPLAAGVVTLALGGRSADDFGERRQYRFDPSWFGHAVFLTDLLALVGVLAVLTGCLLVPHPAARLTTAVAALATGITFIPGFTHLSYALVGLGPTLWRVTWACSVAALVGAGAAYLWQRAPSPRTAMAGAAVAAIALGTFGAPIWRGDTSSSLQWPVHWQRSPDAMRLADWIVRETRDGRRSTGPVLAPDGLSITVAVLTTDVKTVAPRDYYLSALRGQPDAHYDDRLLLTQFVNLAPNRNEAVEVSLRVLDVPVACVYATDLRGYALLQAAGYRRARSSDDYRCLVGPDSGGSGGGGLNAT